MPYDDYVPSPRRAEADDVSDAEEGDWNKRAGGAAALCWLSAGAYYGLKLYPVLRIPGGWAWGLLGDVVAQTTIFLFLCVLLGLALGAVLGIFIKKPGRSFRSAFGKGMTSVMLLLAILNIGWQEGLKRAFPTAAVVPAIAFFNPDPMAGGSGNAADAFRFAINRCGAALLPLFSGKVYPVAEGQTDVEKFRWFVNDRLKSLDDLLPAYRHTMADYQQNGVVDFLTPEWLGRETGADDSLRILEGIRIRAVSCRDRCDAALLSLPGRIADAGFSRPEENSMQGQVGQIVEKNTQLCKSVWEAEVKVVDATVAWLQYLQAHRDRWTAVGGRLAFAQATDRAELERLQNLSQSAAADAKAAEDSLAATMSQDITRGEQALTVQP